MPRIAKKNTLRRASGAQAGEAGGNAGGDSVSVAVNGVRVEVSPELKAAVLRAHQASRRNLPVEMTTTQAAEFLDVSRPFVIKLIQRGDLPCRLVGKHRRIPTGALVEYREKMFQEARQAANEMSRLAQDAGFYDDQRNGPSR
ncbi:MAG: helix-turn-helix domain-containing protein [Planctomycetes bacterium]|nr:helix-turn-helix domain-containing protein [Planctomycetota bacterium]